MLALFAFLSLLSASPRALTVATPRGEATLVVQYDPSGAPVLAAAPLSRALNGALSADAGWVTLTIAHQPFRFPLGAPVVLYQDHLEPMAASASLERDTVFLPLQFVAEVLPRLFSERFSYDAETSRFQEIGPAPVPVKRLSSGLLPGHVVTVDPGHGGVDPGNPGLYFPSGIREKDVNLQVGLALRRELERRGIKVVMTRTTDTLIGLYDRGGYCTESCDLFVSLHVNSLARRRGYTDVRGFETYFLAEAKTEDAQRVARMENDAIRFDPPAAQARLSGLDFILRDLQLNEYLRESARLAELIQLSLDDVHNALDRGVKQAPYAVLTTANRPAVLVEMGYSTNRQDARILTGKQSQEAMASAIADAIVDYLKEYERKAGLTPGGTR